MRLIAVTDFSGGLHETEDQELGVEYVSGMAAQKEGGTNTMVGLGSKGERWAQVNAHTEALR